MEAAKPPHQKILNGYLIKYSRYQQCPRKRYVVLTYSRITDTKTLYTYKCVKDSASSNNATEVIEMKDYYNVEEYYGSLNKENDNLHFLINNTFVFKCKNCTEKEKWIAAIIKTRYYYNKKLNFFAYYKGIKYDYSQVQTNCQFKTLTIMATNRCNNDNKTVWIPIQLISTANSSKKGKFLLNIEYSNRVSIGILFEIINKIIQNLEPIYPKCVKMEKIWCGISEYGEKCTSFIQSDVGGTSELKGVKDQIYLDCDVRFGAKEHDIEIGDTIMKKMITEYDRNIIMKRGLTLDACFMQSPIRDLSCNIKHNGINGTVSKNNGMKNNNNINICEYGLECKTYLKMKNNFEFTKKNYRHLIEYNHFNNNFYNKPVCKYGDQCAIFLRMCKHPKQNINTKSNTQNNGDFDLFVDECHLLVYRHPPRVDRLIRLSSNINSSITINNSSISNSISAANVVNGCFDSKIDDYTHGLILEVIENGFEQDLCLNENDFKHKRYSIMKKVNLKLECLHHHKSCQCLSRSEMLALILYTDSNCGYDLCKSQCNGNYNKWKIFDRLLHKAIVCLHKRQKDYFINDFKLYSRLIIANDEKINNEVLNLRIQNKIIPYFSTYISTSYIKDVALCNLNCQQKENRCLLIEMDGQSIMNEFVCCAVDWISNFGDECEILISRSVKHNGNTKAMLSLTQQELKICKKFQISRDDHDEKRGVFETSA